MTNAALSAELTNPLVLLLDRRFTPAALDASLDLQGTEVPWKLWEASLYEPLRDLLSRPGKELRARLVEAGWELGGGSGDAPEELGFLVELLHAGSLVVDDIEDGSAYRRGKPALHVGYGMPLALNAGNLLYFLPQQLIAELALPAERALALHQRYTTAVVRCHHGQALDLCGRLHDLGQHEVHDAVLVATTLKTGSLTDLAVSLGAVAAGADPARESVLARFGRELGVALQMLDDLGGITSQKRRAKGHEDLIGGRLTWPWAWLSASLDAGRWRELRVLARSVENFGTHPETLAETMRPLLGDLPRSAIRARLRGSHARLEAEVGPGRTMNDLMRHVEMLEASYV